MRKLISILSVAVVLGMTSPSRGVDVKLTLEDKTVTAGSTVAVNVMWTSVAPLNSLSTSFILTAVGGAPVGEVIFSNTPIDAISGTPAFPPFNNANYIFFGDSSDFIIDQNSNPASVATTNWNYDTYNFADSTNSGNDVSPGAGTNLWTTLNLTISGSASGQYQLTMGSSDWNNAANTGALLSSANITGGLITVVVPEPSTMALAGVGALTMVVLARRRKKIVA